MRIRSLLLTALCAIAGLTLTASAAPSDVRYVPNSANLIVRLDVRRVVRNQIVAGFLAAPDTQAALNKARTELAKYGLDLDELFQSELCIFCDLEKFNSASPALDAVVRTGKPMARKVFAAIDADSAEDKAKGVKDRFLPQVIDGKESRVIGGDTPGAIIALEGDLIQISVNPKTLSALTERSDVRVDGIVDPAAIISIVYRMDKRVANKFRRDFPPQIHPVVDGLKLVAVNVSEEGNTIRFKANLFYSADEKAAAAREVFRGFIELARTATEQQGKADVANILKRIGVSGGAREMVVTFHCTGEELIQFVQTIDNGKK